MRLYLGTHEPSWLGRSPRPLFVSLARAGRFGRRESLDGWALDSGGFQPPRYVHWVTMPAAQYLEQLHALLMLAWFVPLQRRDDRLSLHGFGVKSTGLGLYAHALTSCDSLAWSQRGRKAGYHEGVALCGGEHASCGNCYRWAHQWYDARLAQLATLEPPARQQALAL